VPYLRDLLLISGPDFKALNENSNIAKFYQSTYALFIIIKLSTVNGDKYKIIIVKPDFCYLRLQELVSVPVI